MITRTHFTEKLLIGLLAWLVATLSFATDLTDVNEIVDQANKAAFYMGKDGRGETRMLIVDGQGRKQQRQFTILRKTIEDGGAQKFYVRFSMPADVRDTTFLVHKKTDGSDDDRWLYLPGLDLVKRIAAGDKRTSFVGSHFFYEDVSGRNIHADEHFLVETTDQFYVIRNVPKDKGSVEFSEYTVWVDKSTFLPVKTEYKNDQGKIYRRVEALEVKNIQGIPTVTKMKVEDVLSGGYTLNQMGYIAYNLGIDDAAFTERALRNPPIKWLKRPVK